MIALLLATLSLLTPAVHAEVKTLDLDASMNVIQSLLFAGVQADKAQPIYKITVDHFSCKAYYGGAGESDNNDDIYDGLTVYDCTEPSVSGMPAKLLFDTFDKLSETDCGMGKCSVSYEKVECTVDSTQMENSKRFECKLTTAN